MKTFIYELIDPKTGETRYIGKANNPKDRLKEGHLGVLELKSRTYKSNWIKSLLKEGLKPILNIIDEVPLEEWQFWERHYISLYRSWNIKLTNCTDGGDGIGVSWNKGLTRELDERVERVAKLKEGKQLSIETKLKKSKSLKGRKISEDVKGKMSESQKFRERSPDIAYKVWETRRRNGSDKMTEEVKQQISKALTGRKLSKETKLKIGVKNKGKRHSEEVKEKLSNLIVTEETRRKLSLSLLGRKHSEEAKSNMRKPKSTEAKENMSKSKKGKKWSEARRQAQINKQNIV